LRGTVCSIFCRTCVIAGVMRQMCARPSCITTAPTSALAVGSAASRITSMWIASKHSLDSVNLRFFSSSIVWYEPSLTCGFSRIFLPRSRSLQDTASKSTFSTTTSSVSRTRWLSVPPEAVSCWTLRTVEALMRSPESPETRLKTCHMSSSSSGSSVTVPPPSFSKLRLRIFI
jgi:hypothetical protein